MGSMKQSESQPGIPSDFRATYDQQNNAINALNVPQLQMSDLENMGINFNQGMFQPGGTISNSNNLLNQTMQGDFLNPSSNPYLQNVMDIMRQQYQDNLGIGMDALSSQFAGSGQNMDSGTLQSNARLFAGKGLQSLNDAMSNMLYGNYQQERGNQMNAFNFAGVPQSLAFNAGQMGAMPRNLQVQQFGLDQQPIQLRNTLLGNAPMGTTIKGPSPFAQNMSGAGDFMQGVGSIAGAARSVAAPTP